MFPLVSDGNEIYWETSGNPQGKPALYLHDHPEFADSEVLLYAIVDPIEAAEQSLRSEDILIPMRKTFHGSLLIWVKDASGKIIGYAQKS